MRAMGEMLLANLQMESFADLVHNYLGPRAGYILSWSYWLSWVVAAVGDVVVVAGSCSTGTPMCLPGYRLSAPCSCCWA